MVDRKYDIDDGRNGNERDNQGANGDGELNNNIPQKVKKERYQRINGEPNQKCSLVLCVLPHE